MSCQRIITLMIVFYCGWCLLFFTGCSGRSAEQSLPSLHTMSCETVDPSHVFFTLYRCANLEVVCYIAGGREISCFKQ
jgi:hypothetical protein